MTDFDKLIREKAEQAEYTYKPAAWQSFRRMAGMGRSTVKYWIAGVSSAVLIGGLTTVLLLNNGRSTQEDASAPNVVALDTVSMSVDDEAVVGNDTLSLVGNRNPKASQTKVIPSTVSKASVDSPAVPARRTAETSSPDKKAAPRYGRPLVIDVDTIKDNVPTDEQLKNGHSRLY